jgi:hypothetical protein
MTYDSSMRVKRPLVLLSHPRMHDRDTLASPAMTEDITCDCI